MKYQIVATIHCALHFTYADDETLESQIRVMKALAFDRNCCGAAININDEDEFIVDENEQI